MAKPLTEQKTRIGIENRYIFELKDLNLNTIGEYITILKMKNTNQANTILAKDEEIAKLQSAKEEIQKALDKANEELAVLKSNSY